MSAVLECRTYRRKIIIMIIHRAAAIIIHRSILLKIQQREDQTRLRMSIKANGINNPHAGKRQTADTRNRLGLRSTYGRTRRKIVVVVIIIITIIRHDSSILLFTNNENKMKR